MTSRRNFLRNTGAVVTGAAISPFILSSLRAGVSPNDKFTIALIGCHGMGMYDLKDHLKLPEIECGGLCDVDENVLKERAAEIGQLTGKRQNFLKITGRCWRIKVLMPSSSARRIIGIVS